MDEESKPGLTGLDQPADGPGDLSKVAGGKTKKSKENNQNNKRKRFSYRGRISEIFIGVSLLASISHIIIFHPHLSDLHLDQHQVLTDHSDWKVLAANDDLTEKDSEEIESNHTSTNQTPISGASREKFIERLLEKAGVTDLTEEDRARLPSWDNMTALYGPLQEPIVLGMERCQTYREKVPLKRRYAAVAGMFNTGTNAMMFHLEKNINLPSRWQVPWGKHRVPAVRLNHTAPGLDKAVKEDVLPIVITRDPFQWMQSMCKSPYAAKWQRNKKRCPNLVPTAEDQKKFKDVNDTFAVTVYFDKNQIMHWNSLVHLYSDWYRQYLEADYPRLIVRFEDMLLMAPTILQKIAECAGTTLPDTFRYQTGEAKGHGSHTTFAKAIIKSGDGVARLKGLTDDDISFARAHLDSELMELLHYTLPKTKS